MKRIIYTMLAYALIIFAIVACKSTEGLSKTEEKALVEEKINSKNYTFSARTALPLGGPSIPLSSGYYTLKITGDSVIAYLPYYGRSYTAPINPNEGGIKFVSTRFDYAASPKEKGMWNIKIDTQDTPQNSVLTLSVGESGYTTLIVTDNNRQSISFYGEIER